MLFSEKAQFSIQQEDKLKCVLYVTNVPMGSMDLLSIQISKMEHMSIFSSFILIGWSQK
jgi:hypothetical protein